MRGLETELRGTTEDGRAAELPRRRPADRATSAVGRSRKGRVSPVTHPAGWASVGVLATGSADGTPMCTVHPEVVGGQCGPRHRSTHREGWTASRKIGGRAGLAPLPRASGCTAMGSGSGRGLAMARVPWGGLRGGCIWVATTRGPREHWIEECQSPGNRRGFVPNVMATAGVGRRRGRGGSFSSVFSRCWG